MTGGFALLVAFNSSIVTFAKKVSDRDREPEEKALFECDEQLERACSSY